MWQHEVTRSQKLTVFMDLEAYAWANSHFLVPDLPVLCKS